MLHEHGEDVAAVLVEPMLGASGCIPGEAEFIHALRATTSEVGASCGRLARERLRRPDSVHWHRVQPVLERVVPRAEIQHHSREEPGP